MDDWQPDWFRAFETIANEITHEVGHLFEAIGREISEATETLFQLSEEVADEVAEDMETTLVQIDQMIAPKLDQLDEQVGQWLDPVLQTLFGVGAVIDRSVEPVTHTVEPWLNQHPVCIGCRNYHGQEYNGNLLVCAMHPYGVEAGVETCPDKEPVSWNFPGFEWDDHWDDHNDRF